MWFPSISRHVPTFVVIALVAAACSPSAPDRGEAGGSSANGGGTSVAGTGVVIGGGSTGIGGGSVSVGNSGGQNSGGACATDTADAELTSLPVDIIIVLDNSGSMHEEMGAVERNINENFATLLTSSGIDYRVILLSRHRQGARTTGESAANTSVCVTQPLSGLATCPSEIPVFSDRFYQWGEKIESFDALNFVLSGYTTPPEDDDFAALAPTGYSPWLRAESKKVFVVLTDDNEGNTGDTNPLTIDQFLQQLSALSAAHFGSPQMPNFIFHSIIGVREKADPTQAYLANEPLVAEKCTGNGATIPHVGTLYQELSIRTGGLRFPICQFPGYDAVFRRIAQDVTVKASIRCDFPVPAAPAGATVELDNIAVNHVKADMSGRIKFGQASNSADCRPDAFYIENNTVWLCPEACDAVKLDAGASIEVLFTCESQILPPR